MKKNQSSKKRTLTILLALTGIAVTVTYALCLGACSYLKGDIVGIDLKYIGILYMAAVLLLAWFRKTLPCLLLLAFGAGGEIFLIGFQIHSGVYCPYCLAFGATILLALAVNFEPNRKALTAVSAAAGIIFFLFFFSGSATPAYAADPLLPSFGKGPVEVRIYTDYFCGPCSAEEEEVISIIGDLVGKKAIHVLFIDTPIHRETVLFAGYFLAAIRAKNDFEQALSARRALFEAARKGIKVKEPLEAFLKTKGLAIQPYDTTPVFRICSNYLKEDNIRSTPSCVIIDSQGKRTMVGRDEIIKALRGLQK